MKKTFSFLVFTFVFVLNIFAMPYFESFLPDNSGEYVYYKDNSFVRESYIGFLYYDDSTFQLRFFAPEDKENFLPEKNINLYVTVDSTKQNLELTGELISSQILPNSNDTDLVNYLHDMFYEFTSRRIKANSISPKNNDYILSYDFNNDGQKIYTDFMQFGGNVTIIYDALIPLFNIKKIINSEGKSILECVTIGQLKDSNDTDFNDFKGFKTQKTDDNSKQKNKSKKITQSFESQTIVLDENWTKKMENFWTYDDKSLITMTELPELNSDKTLNEFYILRKLLESADGSYTDISNVEILFDEKKNQYKITSQNYLQEKNDSIITTKLLTRKNNTSNEFYYFSISTYNSAYVKNHSYFDKIVKSYKIED